MRKSKMPNKTKRSKSSDNYYKSYKLTTNKGNKELKLLKHAKKHPNDKQSLGHVVPNYTSKQPKSVWDKGRYNAE